MRRTLLALTLASSTFIVAACNGGSSDAPTPTTNTSASTTKSVRGVAAVGAAIQNANVSMKCMEGHPATTTTDSTGHYSIEVTDQSAPCLLAVNGGSVNGSANIQVLHSAATSTDTVANISPLTELALADAMHMEPGAAYELLSASLADKLNNAALTDAQNVINSQMIALRTAAAQTKLDDYFTGNLDAGNPSNPLDLFLEDIGKGLEKTDVPLSALVAVLTVDGSLSAFVNAALEANAGGSSSQKP